MLSHLSVSALEKSIQKRSESLNLDLARLMPQWAREDAKTLFSRHRFVVCGSVSGSEVRVLSQLGEVIAIVDDFLSQTRTEQNGIPVIHSDDWIDLARRNPDVVSCILLPTARAYQYFMRQCIQWGLPYLDPLQFIYLVRQSGSDTRGETGRFFWYGYEFFEHAVQNAGKLIELAGCLDDEYSKLSWLCFVLYRMTLDPLYLDAVAVGHGYDRFGLNSYAFNRQLFAFSDAEFYVDGGAFSGETVEYFLRAVSGKFRHVCSFEPDPENNRAIRSRLQRLQAQYPGMRVTDQISVFEKGLWDSEGMLHFVPGQTLDGAKGTAIGPRSAHLAETGILDHLYDAKSADHMSISVPVTTIDAATGEEATLIKLEVEGAELQALKGAVGTIQRQRPQMAVSIYHKPEDLITLTEFVLDTGQDYRLGFRQHNPFCPDATILYCYR